MGGCRCYFCLFTLSCDLQVSCFSSVTDHWWTLHPIKAVTYFRNPVLSLKWRQKCPFWLWWGLNPSGVNTWKHSVMSISKRLNLNCSNLCFTIPPPSCSARSVRQPHDPDSVYQTESSAQLQLFAPDLSLFSAARIQSKAVEGKIFSCSGFLQNHLQNLSGTG